MRGTGKEFSARSIVADLARIIQEEIYIDFGFPISDFRFGGILGKLVTLKNSFIS